MERAFEIVLIFASHDNLKIKDSVNLLIKFTILSILFH